MARQTRADRRARRQAREQSAAPKRRPEVESGGNGAAAPERRPEPRAQAAHHERRGIPGIRFARESWGELQKVEWPNQNQLIQGVIVVIVACVIVGFYLWVADLAFKRLVQHVFI